MVKKKDSYETLMIRLDNILREMENEGLDLEKSMKNYEEGINICNKMFRILNDVEAKVKVLTEGGEKDFIEGDE
jgi:exodeoxyribonuclease VII small subunit